MFSPIWWFPEYVRDGNCPNITTCSREEVIPMSKLMRRLLGSSVLGVLITVLASGAADAKLASNHNETLVADK